MFSESRGRRNRKKIGLLRIFMRWGSKWTAEEYSRDLNAPEHIACRMFQSSASWTQPKWTAETTM